MAALTREQLDRAISECLKRHDFAGAARVAEEVEDWPRAAHYWGRAGDSIRHAEARAKHGEYHAAAELFERGGNFARAALIYEEHDDFVRAAVLYERGREPLKAAHLLVRALKAHHLMGQEAEEVCRRAAVMYEAAGDIERALAVLKVGKQHVFAGQLLRRAGRLDAAIEELVAGGDLLAAAEVAREMGNDQRALLLLAERAMKEGRVHDAATHFQQAGDLAQAAKLFEFAGEHRRAAAAYELARQFELAASLYEKVGGVEDAARCLRAAGETRAADLIVERQQKSNDPPPVAATHLDELLDVALMLLARARGGELSSYPKAIRCLSQVPETHKSYVRARTQLAIALSEHGERQQAIETLEKMLSGARLDSNHRGALYEYGKLLEMEGRLAEARRTYRMLRDVDSSFGDVSQRLSLMGNTGSFVPPPPPPPSREAEEDTERMPAIAGHGDEDYPLGIVLRNRFRIERTLGDGSQAKVYLARDVVLDRSVAIKVLDPGPSRNKSAVARFLTEARFAARIHHPNCLGVYDFGCESELIFIAMEYSDGESLRQVLVERGPLEMHLALSITSDIANALSAVHRAGIIHRDVKPSNIMINRDGRACLTDFGVAVVAGKGPTDRISGTLMYMSPEQASRAGANPFSDVYSLAAVLFEMLSGASPFEGTLESLVERTSNPPPELPPDLEASRGVRELLRSCLEPNFRERYTALELADAVGVQMDELGLR